MEVTVPEFMYSWTPMTETMIDKTKEPSTTFMGKNQFDIHDFYQMRSLRQGLRLDSKNQTELLILIRKMSQILLNYPIGPCTGPQKPKQLTYLKIKHEMFRPKKNPH